MARDYIWRVVTVTMVILSMVWLKGYLECNSENVANRNQNYMKMATVNNYTSEELKSKVKEITNH